MTAAQSLFLLAIGGAGEIIHIPVLCHPLNGKSVSAVGAEKQARKPIRLVEFRVRPFGLSHLLYRIKGFLVYDRLLGIEMMKYRRRSLQNITSERGIKLRVNRSIQVEGAFGVIKENYAFRRFLTRGKRKTETQFFLIAFAFNILKFHNKRLSNRLKAELFDIQAS